MTRRDKPAVELIRRLGSSPEDALERLATAVENGSGTVIDAAHVPFVRAAAQKTRDDMERTRERKAQMKAALEGQPTP